VTRSRTIPGYRGTDEACRHQCLTCWGWKHPAIHSCPGVPQAGRTPPPTPRPVQRKRTAGWRLPPDTVNVTRPTKFGNPYIIGRTGSAHRWTGWYVGDCRDEWANHGEYPTKEEAAERAVDLFRAQTWLIREDIARELRGFDLACWCALDQPCHRAVLLELANGPGR
jgi:Domain of unknown function (DUF4326)